MRIHTSEELRAVDRHAAEVLKLPTAWLMESAGRAVADAVVELRATRTGRVFVVCGKGNNGGDGWCAARHLASRAVPVSLVTTYVPADLSPDALAHARAAQSCDVLVVGLESVPGRDDIVVDAVLGTGLNRAAEGTALALVEFVRQSRTHGALVVSIDLPSGLDADKPVPPGPCVEADVTLALHALKPALVQYPAKRCAGEVRLLPLGLPESAATPVRRLAERSGIDRLLTPRALDAHKGTAGHVLVVAGSAGRTGAAMLAGRGALRGGAGLVTLAMTSHLLDRVLPSIPEVMGLGLDDASLAEVMKALEGKKALVAGPGLGEANALVETIVDALQKARVPSVLDADALNALARSPRLLDRLSKALVMPVLTPHPAELARLVGASTAFVQADRFVAATEAARRFNAIVVLKGAGTVVAMPSGDMGVVDTGTPAMATAGSGDVLAGFIGALLSQGLGPFDAGVAGAWLHGRAGELAAQGDRGLLASDIADALPRAMSERSGT